jgi:hypothetical protein
MPKKQRISNLALKTIFEHIESGKCNIHTPSFQQVCKQKDNLFGAKGSELRRRAQICHRDRVKEREVNPVNYIKYCLRFQVEFQTGGDLALKDLFHAVQESEKKGEAKMGPRKASSAKKMASKRVVEEFDEDSYINDTIQQDDVSSDDADYAGKFFVCLWCCLLTSLIYY